MILFLQRFFIFCLFLTLFGIASTVGVFFYFSQDLPKLMTLEDYQPLGVTRIFATGEAGEPIEVGEFLKERRYIIPYEKIPDWVVKAFIAAEDDKFFEHPGINIVSMIRAGIANFRAGHVVQGGSTITQQVAKSLLLTPEKSYDRKIKEVILASKIEQNLSKKQILFLYLNQIYLGRGAYGVAAASRSYFKKDISQLSLAEAALLAGLPQAPSKYSPVINPKKAKERQLYVLKRMLENRWITQKQMTEEAVRPIPLYFEENLNQIYAPYYIEHIRRYLLEKYGEKAVYEEGLSVFAPFSVKAALTATRSMQEGLRDLDKRLGYRGPLQYLKSQTEIDAFLETQKGILLQKKLKYRLFLPDGSLNQLEAFRFSNLSSERELLEPRELYPAVVMEVDLKKKITYVRIGSIVAQLPFEKMSWARLLAENAYPGRSRIGLSFPQDFFQRGDVILVSLAHSEKHPPLKDEKKAEVTVFLEQEPQVQGALFSMDVKTGYVLAMVGGYDFKTSEFNRATQALRQPGSAFKPVVYASALEKGFTPASIIVDSPMVFRDSEVAWKPDNYGKKFYGDTTFRQALIKSRNIPTVKIVQAIQIPYLIDYAKRLGMSGPFSPDLSISLGSSTISLMNLTRIYSIFPRLGRRLEPIFMTDIQKRDGKALETNRPKPNLPSTAFLSSLVHRENESDFHPTTPALLMNQRKTVTFPSYPLSDDLDQVMDPRVASVMTHLMREVIQSGTGIQAKALGKMVAGKTGTTNDSMDAWFLGFTPEVVTGVWVGFDQQKALGLSETGNRSALPIWLRYMQEILTPQTDEKKEPQFPIPPGVVFARIHPATGKLISERNSPSGIEEAFIAGTEPTLESQTVDGDGDLQSEFFKEDRNDSR